MSSSGWPTNSASGAGVRRDPGHPAVVVERRLEREHQAEPVHAPHDLAHAPAPPRPHLRADVIKHRNSQRLDTLGKKEVELREVDQDHQPWAVPRRESASSAGRRTAAVRASRRSRRSPWWRRRRCRRGCACRPGAAVLRRRPTPPHLGSLRRSASTRAAPCTSPEASPATSRTLRASGAHAVSRLLRISSATSRARSAVRPSTSGRSRVCTACDEVLDLVEQRVALAERVLFDRDRRARHR